MIMNALKVHKTKEKDSKKEKYLGDIVRSSGHQCHNRGEKSKALAMVSEIQAILDDIPLGKYEMEIGLKLRQAMLINSVLFKSEA